VVSTTWCAGEAKLLVEEIFDGDAAVLGQLGRLGAFRWLGALYA